MNQFLARTTLLVRDYDEAIDFYVHTLGFTLVEDTPLADPQRPALVKRWVSIAPAGSEGAQLLLARAVGSEQEARIGDQTGGRVFLFLFTDDFWRDYELYRSRGVQFVKGGPREESYGTVGVFADLYGNLWDLVQPTDRRA